MSRQYCLAISARAIWHLCLTRHARRHRLRGIYDSNMSLPDRPQGNAFNDPFNGPEARRRSTKDKRPSVFSSSDSDVGAADDVLGALGYDQELSRNRSTLQVAFMSFVLASIPYGLSTTFTYPLAGGGPANIVWGWFMVSLIILCVAISLGEITSVYPTSGGVYFQTYMLSPARYKRILAWFCGWAFTVGNITITLSVNFGSALFFVACVNIFESSPGVPIWDAETYQIFLVFLAITIFCNAVSAFGNKWLPVLDVCERPSDSCPHLILSACEPPTLSIAYLFMIDICYLLDTRRRGSACCVCARIGTWRTSLSRLCVHRGSPSIWLAVHRLVIHGRPPTGRIRDIVDRYDPSFCFPLQFFSLAQHFRIFSVDYSIWITVF